jgi:hypothetical protein
MAEQAAETPADPAPEQAAAAAPESAPAAAGGDALLSMFSSTETLESDFHVLVDLAGDVDMDDLLEQLHTVAAALGIDATAIDGAEDAYEAEELLAA